MDRKTRRKIIRQIRKQGIPEQPRPLELTTLPGLPGGEPYTPLHVLQAQAADAVRGIRESTLGVYIRNQDAGYLGLPQHG